MYICKCNNKMSIVTFSRYFNREQANVYGMFSISLSPFIEFHIYLSSKNNWIEEKTGHLVPITDQMLIICPNCFKQIGVQPDYPDYISDKDTRNERLIDFYEKYFKATIPSSHASTMDPYTPLTTPEDFEVKRKKFIGNYLTRHRQAFSVFKDKDTNQASISDLQNELTKLLVDYDDFIKLYNELLTCSFINLTTEELLEVQLLQRYLHKYI